MFRRWEELGSKILVVGLNKENGETDPLSSTTREGKKRIIWVRPLDVTKKN